MTRDWATLAVAYVALVVFPLAVLCWRDLAAWLTRAVEQLLGQGVDRW